MDKSDTSSATSDPDNSPKQIATTNERKKKRPQLKRTIAKNLDDEPGIDFEKL